MKDLSDHVAARNSLRGSRSRDGGEGFQMVRLILEALAAAMDWLRSGFSLRALERLSRSHRRKGGSESQGSGFSPLMAWLSDSIV
jgi:hypothetical protein